MAIRFDKAFNAEIRREVGKVNKKFARARQLGYTHVPRNVSVKELKRQFASKYATRNELRRSLARMGQVNTRDLSKVVELETGTRTSLVSLRVAEQKRLRLLRLKNKRIRKLEARDYNTKTPFVRTELDTLYNERDILMRGVRSSESQMYRINEMYNREFSGKKKESFEQSLRNTMRNQIKMSNLSDEQQAELLGKIERTDVDTLIEINKNEGDFADILDRYKGKNDYNAFDAKTFQDTYENIYNNFDKWVEGYAE